MDITVSPQTTNLSVETSQTLAQVNSTSTSAEVVVKAGAVLEVVTRNVTVGVIAPGLQGPAGPMGPEYEAPDEEVLVDKAGAYTYFGFAPQGSVQNEPNWRIKRLRDKVVVEYADGNEQYDNVWSNRAALTYL